MRKLYIITTIGIDHINLLPYFFDYYSKFNVKKILLLVNTFENDKYFQVIQSWIKLQPFAKKCVLKNWSGSFNEDEKIWQEIIFINENCKHKDWVLYTDIDEFQYYPKNIQTSIQHATDLGFNYLEGRLIDRVSVTGELTKFDYSLSLEVQYPIGGLITNNLLKAWDKKIVCAEATKIVGGGHHIFLNQHYKSFNGFNTQLYTDEISPFSFGIEVHHFKWNSKILDKVKRQKIFQHPSLKAWQLEHDRLLEYFENNTKFDFQDATYKWQYYGNKLKI